MAIEESLQLHPNKRHPEAEVAFKLLPES
ncbi:hypothetical protein CCACVL1_21581 [Corchorus capsularis]|uniref:Uncharacterized protein n=1 Tax=Corchorus capsularis TaxID=210143 RepID=A0A1R3H446_COCAP|nr:hypothetical protein CCACVL1_21581 [Corchorus capsularis]